MVLRVAFTLAMSCVALIATGCGSKAETCATQIDLTCTPLYPPTFDAVYTHTLHATCATAGGACHAPEGALGGLIFADPDESYALLLGKVDGRPRVLAGDAACSVLTERLEGTGTQLMPPGAPLPAGERCAIEQWIEAGAKR